MYFKNWNLVIASFLFVSIDASAFLTWKPEKMEKCVKKCGADWCTKCEGYQDQKNDPPLDTKKCECTSGGAIFHNNHLEINKSS